MITCRKCKETKEEKEFSKYSGSSTGYQVTCKDCVKAYYRSKRGLALQMHTHQRQSSVKRGHPEPSYTKEKLYDWLMSQPKFHELYDNWVKSGFNSKLRPSIDRLDDYKGYSFDNIQLMTFKENNQKSHADRINGNNRKQSRAVNKLDLNGKFISHHHSINDAARSIGKPTGASNIKLVCDGKCNSRYGFKWEWT